MRKPQTLLIGRTWRRLAASVIIHALLDAVDEPINRPDDYYERLRRLNRDSARAWLASNEKHPGSLLWWSAALRLEPAIVRAKLQDFDEGRDTIGHYARQLIAERTAYARHEKALLWRTASESVA